MSSDEDNTIDSKLGEADVSAIQEAIDWLHEVEEYDRLKTGDSKPNLRKRIHTNSNEKTDNIAKRRSNTTPREVETDQSMLDRRQKQIDYGKNTIGYANYRKKVTINDRTREDPKTPDKYTKYSRRSWDTLIKTWRKKLHEYDPSDGKEELKE